MSDDQDTIVDEALSVQVSGKYVVRTYFKDSRGVRHHVNEVVDIAMIDDYFTDDDKKHLELIHNIGELNEANVKMKMMIGRKTNYD